MSEFHVALDGFDRRALVGGLDVGERLLHLVLPGCVLGERVALGVDALLVEHHELLGDLAYRGADLALGLREVGAAEAVQLRRFAADVLAQRVDLVGRHVELVATLVRDQQVVAFDAADRPLDHALVLADAVLVVHDVVAGLEVLERGRRFALLLADGAVGAAPTGEIALGDDRHLGVRQGAAAVQRGDGDAAAGLQLGARRDHGEVEAVVEQELVEALRRTGAVGGDDHAIALADQLDEPIGQAGAVTTHRAPTGGLDQWRVGRLRRGVDRPERPCVRR